MNFINCLLDVNNDDWDISDQGFSEVIKDRARQMAGIDPEELSCSDLD